MLHARPEVSGAASDAMLAVCLTVGNRDLEPHVPAIVGCIAKAELVPEVIGKLSATTFVQVGQGWAGRGDIGTAQRGSTTGLLSMAALTL